MIPAVYVNYEKNRELKLLQEYSDSSNMQTNKLAKSERRIMTRRLITRAHRFTILLVTLQYRISRMVVDSVIFAAYRQIRYGNFYEIRVKK